MITYKNFRGRETYSVKGTAGLTLDILFLTRRFRAFPRTPREPFIRDLALGLVRAGDRVTVLTPRRSGGWVGRACPCAPFRYAPESREVLGWPEPGRRRDGVRLAAGLVKPLYLLSRATGRAPGAGPVRYDLVHAHWVVPNGWRRRRWRCRRWRSASGHGSDVFMAEKAGIGPGPAGP
ncbi:MAG: glycosyltransferase [Thermoanaerobaculia bacterium]